jgi:hypothetical protein
MWLEWRLIPTIFSIVGLKYGSSRGVVGTPTYLVNGVAVAGADESWSVDDWRKVFDPLLRTPGFVAKA